jgi:hypothetical protein
MYNGYYRVTFLTRVIRVNIIRILMKDLNLAAILASLLTHVGHSSSLQRRKFVHFDQRTLI